MFFPNSRAKTLTPPLQENRHYKMQTTSNCYVPYAVLDTLSAIPHCTMEKTHQREESRETKNENKYLCPSHFKHNLSKRNQNHPNSV